MFSFIVSNSGFLIHRWLITLDIRRCCTVRQLIPLEQIYLADASEWYPFCSDSDLRRTPTIHKNFLQALRNLLPFGPHSDRTWAYNLNGDSFRKLPYALAGTADLLPLGFLLEFTRGRLGTNSFCCPFGSLLLFAIRGDSFSEIPPCFPPLGVSLNSLFARNSVFPCRGFTVLLLSWGNPSARSMSNGRSDSLYGWGVVHRKIATHGIPPLPSQRQLKDDNIRFMEVEHL